MQPRGVLHPKTSSPVLLSWCTAHRRTEAGEAKSILHISSPPLFPHLPSSLPSSAELLVTHTRDTICRQRLNWAFCYHLSSILLRPRMIIIVQMSRGGCRDPAEISARDGISRRTSSTTQLTHTRLEVDTDQTGLPGHPRLGKVPAGFSFALKRRSCVITGGGIGRNCRPPPEPKGWTMNAYGNGAL